METKLTLKMDQKIITLVKKYASRNNNSLSQLVENYFQQLVSEHDSQPKYSPLVQELSSVISEQDLADLDYPEYLTNKYA